MLRVPGMLFLAALAACAAAPTPRSDLAWELVPDESLALRCDGDVVWQFHFGSGRTKPCFHPLALPGTGALTVDQPADHRWHHGLWFSWKYIDGVNYWENDPKTGRPSGRTTWRTVEVAPRADGSARLVLDLDYAPADGTAVLGERRVIETSPPAADGTFAIDWHGEFVAHRACTLDRTPLPGESGGKPFGGYAGLSLRLAQLDDRDAITTAGAVAWNEQDRFRGTASGFDYRGALAGRQVGVAILDHPDNLRSPSPWYAIRSKAMSFVTPAVLCFGKAQLAAGERFGLRYRIVVHPGRWSGPELAAAVASYVTPNAPQKP